MAAKTRAPTHTRTCHILRYVDDVRLIIVSDADTSTEQADKEAETVFACTYRNLPWKRDTVSPFIGLHLGTTTAGLLTWWPIKKSFRGDGTRVESSKGVVLATLQHWRSWSAKSQKLGVFTGALLACEQQSCGEIETLCAIANVLLTFEHTAGFPKDELRGRLSQWWRRHSLSTLSGMNRRALFDALKTNSLEDFIEDLAGQLGNPAAVLAVTGYTTHLIRCSVPGAADTLPRATR
jgi:hypothetical protein